MEAIIEALADVTLGQLFSALTVFIGLVLTYIEFSKRIKWNPLSDMLKWFGSKLTAPIYAKIEEQSKQYDCLASKIDGLRDTQDDNEIDRIRWEILNFARSCRSGEWHATDEFEHIMDLNVKYHGLLDRRNLKNGRIDLEYNYIVRTYEQAQSGHDNS